MTATMPRAADVTGHAAPPARRHRIAVGLLTFAAAALYLTLSVNRFVTYRSATYDLVIFDQAVRSYSRFHLPVAIVKGVHNGFGPHFAVLGDHFSPLLAVLAPLYWIHDGPVTLLVAQAVLFAAAIPPLWVLVRRELGAPAAYCVSGAYALSFPVAQAVGFDFHETAFAPVLLAVALERLSVYRLGRAPWWHVAVPCVLLLGVKEDMGLLVAGIGVLLLLRRGPGLARRLALAAAFVVVGLVMVVVATRLLIPAFGGRADYYWTYSQLGPTVPAALHHIVVHPRATLHTFTHPAVKVDTMAWLFAIPALAALGSPYLVLIVPLLAERMLSDGPNYWTTDFHYNAYLVVPLLAAGVDTVARIRRRLPDRSGRRLGTVWGVLTLAVAAVSVPQFNFGPLAEPSSWQRTADVRALAAVAAHVPDGVLVEAVQPVGPHISGRTRDLLWDRTPRYAPWVVADVQRQWFPFCTLKDQQDRVALLEHSGYRVVFADRGYLVLHDPAAKPQLLAPPAPKCP